MTAELLPCFVCNQIPQVEFVEGEYIVTCHGIFGSGQNATEAAEEFNRVLTFIVKL